MPKGFREIITEVIGIIFKQMAVTREILPWVSFVPGHKTSKSRWLLPSPVQDAVFAVLFIH